MVLPVTPKGSRMRPRTGFPKAPILAAALAASSLVVGGVGLVVLSGCAGEDKQLDSMRSELDEIESSRDEADRKATLPPDVDSTDVAPRVVASASPPAPAAAPVVAVPREVTLGAFDEAPDEYADTEDSSPRPTIHVIGSPRPGRGGWRGDDQVEQSGVDDGAAAAQAAQPSALDPAAKHAYEAALALVNARQYPQALDALAAFLVKWPDHPYANNAMYWRGEAYFARGEYARASEQFEGVLARYPGGNKVPDALLKLGLCAQKAGDPAKAKSYFDRLTQQYPQSEAARRIPSAPTSPSPAPGPVPEDHK
jgi:tol-pal system protein YbgF